MANATKPTSLTTSNIVILKCLLGIVAAIFTIHVTLQFMVHILGLSVPDTFVGRFDVDNEISIPTWYSQLLLFIPAVLALLIYKTEKAKHLARAWYWLLFAALFVFLSADEGAMLHEAFITKFREWTTDGAATGLANHLWLIPVVVVILALLIPFVKFSSRLPRRTVILLITGLGTLAFGAIVYETFGLIVFAESSAFAYQGINVAIEEALELIGSSITVYAVLEHLRFTSPDTTIKLER